MGVALRRRMHDLAFRCKLAHWAFVDLHTKLLAPLGITPARLDLLHALADEDNADYGAALARILGVARQTIHEMTDALVARGLVRRLPRDERTRIVPLRLTDAARALLDDVFAVFVRSGVTLKSAARTLRDAPRDAAKVRAFVESARCIQGSLGRVGCHVSPSIDPDEAVGGTDLDDRLRPLFDGALRTCRRAFALLPIEYVSKDLDDPAYRPLEMLAF